MDNGHVYSDADASWDVPATGGGDNRSAAQWVGVSLGASSAYQLVQAGVTLDGYGVNRAFIEAYPAQQEVFENSYDIHAHDLVYSHVVSSTNSQVFHLIDVTYGEDHTYTTGFASAPDGHAEFIFERNCDSSQLHPIPSWSDNDSFLNARAAYSGHWYPGGSLPQYGKYSYSQNAGQIMVEPGAWSTNQSDFLNEFLNPGANDGSC